MTSRLLSTKIASSGNGVSCGLQITEARLVFKLSFLLRLLCRCSIHAESTCFPAQEARQLSVRPPDYRGDVSERRFQLARLGVPGAALGG